MSMSVIACFQHLTPVHHETLTFLPCAVWNSTNPGRAVRVDNTALSAIGKSEPLLKNEEGGFPSPIENAGSRGASQSPQWVRNFVQIARPNTIGLGANPFALLLPPSAPS